MNLKLLALLVGIFLLSLPALAQETAHDDHPAPTAATDTHADEHDTSREAAASGGRPAWAWPAALLLLAAGVGASVAGRRGQRRRAAFALATGCGLLALVLLRATLPPAGLEARAEAGHDDHEDEHGDDSPFVEVDAETAAALGLQTETVAPAELVLGLQATGRIIPVEARQAHLGSRLSGRLTAVRVRVGERVEAGQVVATLDSVDAAQAVAVWRESGARLAAAERTLATSRQLVASGVFTAAPWEEARRQLAEARVEQAASTSALAQARNEAEAARAELARTERLVAGGSFTTAAVEEARQRLAETERGLAEALAATSDAEADLVDATGAVALARQRVASAESLRRRTASLAATGELDRAPLEQAQNVVAGARARLQQVEVALAQAQRQAARGEELYRAELLALNDLESRRAAVSQRESERQEAATSVANANAALKRQEQIAAAGMASGRASQEAQNTVAEAQRELSAAEAREAKAESRVEVVREGVAPAQAAVAAARSALQREEALAHDETRSRSVLDSARLRVAQADRIVQGKQGEVTEAGRKVQVATAAVTREQDLAARRIRGREQLLGAEAEVRAARIGRDSAAEILQLLGVSTKSASRAHGPVQIPIRTPVTGLVTELDATVGEAVSGEQDLMAVVDLSEVYVEADVYEQDLPRISEGQPVLVTVRAYPDEPIPGVVVSISGQLDPETRAAHVRALLTNADWRLRPEMFATVSFSTDRSGSALTVSTEAVQEVEGGPVVFVQRGPTRYEVVPVTLGRREGDRVEVTLGLTAGAVVVTTGSYLVKSQRLKGELGEGHAH